MIARYMQSKINDRGRRHTERWAEIEGIFTSFLTVVIDCADKANRHVIQDTWHWKIICYY